MEEAHGNDLAEFRVGHPHEDANRLLDPEELALFGGNLLRSYRRSHGLHIQRRTPVGEGREFDCRIDNRFRRRTPPAGASPDGWVLVEGLLQFRYPPELLESDTVVGAKQFTFFERGDVFHGYIDA